METEDETTTLKEAKQLMNRPMDTFFGFKKPSQLIFPDDDTEKKVEKLSLDLPLTDFIDTNLHEFFINKDYAEEFSSLAEERDSICSALTYIYGVKNNGHVIPHKPPDLNV